MGRIVFGIQPVREAIRVHGARIERLAVDRHGGPKIEALARWAKDQGVTVETAEAGDIDRRAAGGRHQGVVALVPDLRIRTIEELEVHGASTFVVLDGVMDPQNFGAIVRSAVALGASAVIWAEHSSAPLSPAMFRASAGAIEHAVLCRVPSLIHAIQRLREKAVSVVALDAQGQSLLSAVDLSGPVALIVGAEDKGVRRSMRRECTFVARLPMEGPIGSLNASVAGAVALYEVLRQRRGNAERTESALPGFPTSSS